MTTTSRQDVVQKIVEASVEVRTQDDGAGRRRGDERRHPMVEPVRILKDDHRQSAGRPLTLGHDELKTKKNKRQTRQRRQGNHLRRERNQRRLTRVGFVVFLGGFFFMFERDSLECV